MTETESKRERSVAYPSLSIEKAIDLTSELRASLGKGPYGRHDASVALGHKGISGPSSMKISALVHFGLLNRYGNAYSQSELAERINHPLSDEDRAGAITDAAKMPKLYKELLTQFAGQALPTQLTNILVRKGVSAKVAQSVASDFKATMEFVGLLKNGVLFDVAEPQHSTTAPALTQEDSIEKQLVAPLANGQQKYAFSDAGGGWALIVKSEKPIPSSIKRMLIDAMEKLETEDD